jgi:phage regulator Rha-like protein
MSDIVLKRPNGETFTTSLLLAEKFKKEHRTILRKIKSLPKDDFTEHNFVLSEYIDESGKTNKQYELTVSFWEGISPQLQLAAFSMSC